MFITWLLGVGRFCLAVKYGRYSLRGADWHVDAWSGLRITPSPLDQARHEALQVSEALQRRLNRRVPVSPALVLFEMEGDRSIERLARRRRIPLFWNLERYTGTLVDAATGPARPIVVDHPPRLGSGFCSRNRTVSWDSDSTKPSSTTLPASARSVQWSWPSGAGLQARAIR